MSKKPPSLMQLSAIALFTLSCFGLLLYLWLAFGGPTPLLAKSYEFKVAFPEATQLATQSDVRISGVHVGRVSELDLAPDGERTMATIELDPEYGPIPEDTQAILRAKTLLSETYVDLTPGDPESPMLADGAELSQAQVARQIQLDEIMRTFDSETREAFQIWMQSAGEGAFGQGLAFNNALGAFQPTFVQFDRLLRVLDSQSAAVRRLFRDGAETFRAFSRQPGELSGMVRNFDQVFQTTAQRNQDIEAMFRAFPTFLDESRLTADRFAEFSVDTEPLMRQLTPAATELSGTLIAFAELAPELRGFFRAAIPVIRNAPAAFEAFRRLFRDDFPPLLRDVQPFLHQINPLLELITDQRRELAGFLGNVAAAMEAQQPGRADGFQPHYLRTIPMLSAEGFATFDGRLEFNRANPYVKPGQQLDVGRGGLRSFHTAHCADGLRAELDPDTPEDPAFNERVDGDIEDAETLFERIQQFAFADSLSTDNIPAAPCEKQGPYTPYGIPGGPEVDYPQVWRGR